ncbi:MAG TPA: dihydroneopterin aldolase [Candidatus Rubrimentiphilum sp.]|nr:dihydroneopterin aldolase [Candidatus Rubrimentiphilum sp.]
MDLIRLDEIRTHGRHGANPGERDAAQVFEIDVQLEVDLRVAESSDNLHDTIDYAGLREAIAHVVETTSFALLERLGGEILHTLFHDPRIARAEITIAKPHVLEGATPSVTLRRDNPASVSR